MSGKFIATIVAASIALTTIGTAPVHARDRDVERALAALLGVAIVGKIIHDKKKDKRTVTRHTTQPVYTQPRPKPRNHPRRGHAIPVQPRDHIQPRPIPQQVNKRLLPAQCLRSIRSGGRTYNAFGRGCLKNNYRFVQSLPQQCSIQIPGRNGLRQAFAARCLRDQGYRLARG